VRVRSVDSELEWHLGVLCSITHYKFDCMIEWRGSLASGFASCFISRLLQVNDGMFSDMVVARTSDVV